MPKGRTLKVSTAHIARFLRGRKRPLEHMSDGLSHKLELKTCRAYGRTAKLDRATVYIAKAEHLSKPVRLPADSLLLVAGKPSRSVTITGQFITVASISAEELLNDIIELFQVFSEFETDLHLALERGASAQELIDRATPLFDNELLLMNSRLKMLAHSYDRIVLYDMSGLDQLADDDFAPMELSSFFQNDAIFHDVEKLRGAFYYEPSIFSIRLCCLNIVEQNEYAARLVLCETTHEIEQCDENLFVYFGSFIQRWYDQVGAESESREDALAAVVGDLLDNVAVSPARIDAAYSRRGWNRDDALVCACVMSAGYESHERTLPFLSSQISLTYPETCTVERGEYMAMLVNLSEHGDNPDSFFALTSIMQRESNLRIGQSPVFRSIEDVGGRFTQAKAALEIALEKHPQRWRNTFTSLRLEYLKHALDGSIETRLLVAEEIERLARYDEANSTSYVDTLRAYCDAGMNALEASRKLYVHRATMVYRLGRIREIGGIDFNDQEQMLYIRLSLKVFG